MVAFYKYDYVFDIVLDFSCFFFIKLSTGKRIVTAFVLSAAYEFEMFVQENTERLLFNLLTFIFEFLNKRLASSTWFSSFAIVSQFSMQAQLFIFG